jgi:hypothetical protein
VFHQSACVPVNFDIRESASRTTLFRDRKDSQSGEEKPTLVSELNYCNSVYSVFGAVIGTVAG